MTMKAKDANGQEEQRDNNQDEQHRRRRVTRHQGNQCSAPSQSQSQSQQRAAIQQAFHGVRWFVLHPLLVVLFLLLVVGSVESVVTRRRKNGNPLSRLLRFINHSGVRVDVYWIDPNTRQLGPPNSRDGEGVAYGSDLGISSFVGHAFEVQELPTRKGSDECQGRLCRKAYFKVNNNEDQWLTLDKSFSITHEDHTTRAKSKAKDTIQKCSLQHITSNNNTTTATTTKISAAQQLELLAACLREQIDSTLADTNDEISFQSVVRQHIGDQLVEYACRDASMTTSSSVHNQSWTSSTSTRHAQALAALEGRASSSSSRRRPTTSTTHHVSILFESPHSNVMLVHNVLEKSHCQVLLDHAESVPRTNNGNNSNNNNINDEVDDPLAINATLSWITTKRMENVTLDAILAKLETLLQAASNINVVWQQQQEDGNKNDRLAALSTGLKIQTRVATTPPAAAELQPKLVKDNNDKDETKACSLGESEMAGTCHAATTTATTTATNPKPQIHRVMVDDARTAVSMFVFCEVPEQPGAALHFAKTGVHVHVQEKDVGTVLIVNYRNTQTGEREPDPFLNDLAFCPVVSPGKFTMIMDHV